VTAPSIVVPADALAGLPSGLRDDLLNAFAEVVINYAQGRWEPSELNAGKVCEAAYCICRGYADGSYPARASKPPDLIGKCRALESETSAPRSIRVQIPRVLGGVYEIRNNRGVGHVGGDVDPNHMDAVLVLQTSKWVVAELIRVLHGLSVDDASDLVEMLAERETPLVWKIAGRKRVLDPEMANTGKTLLLLHSTPGAVDESDLARWVEVSSTSNYRRDVLRPLHRRKLIEYDEETREVWISPRGVERVETTILQAG